MSLATSACAGAPESCLTCRRPLPGEQRRPGWLTRPEASPRAVGPEASIPPASRSTKSHRPMPMRSTTISSWIPGHGSSATQPTPGQDPRSTETSSLADVSRTRQLGPQLPRRMNSSASSSWLKTGNTSLPVESRMVSTSIQALSLFTISRYGCRVFSSVSVDIVPSPSSCVPWYYGRRLPVLAPQRPPMAPPMNGKRSARMPETVRIVPNPCCGTLC